MSTLDLYRATMTEDDMLTPFRDLARATGGRLWHVRQAQGQEIEGLTDVLIAIPHPYGGVLGAFELKTQRDVVSAEQLAVAEVLARCDRLVSGIVRPVPRDGELSLDDALDLLR